MKSHQGSPPAVLRWFAWLVFFVFRLFTAVTGRRCAFIVARLGVVVKGFPLPFKGRIRHDLVLGIYSGSFGAACFVRRISDAAFHQMSQRYEIRLNRLVVDPNGMGICLSSISETGSIVSGIATAKHILC
jgi:hypothetical protein